MPNRNYINGANKERKIVNAARERGAVSFRSAGSHSPIDVIIIEGSTIRLIQSKPKSMSQAKKDALQAQYGHLEGDYKVTFEVI